MAKKAKKAVAKKSLAARAVSVRGGKKQTVVQKKRRG
jgi:hypothetical protein